MNDNKVIIYTANDGKTKIDVKLEEETLWLTQAQMCELYQTSKSNVSEHIKHIFEEEELNEVSVVRNSEQLLHKRQQKTFVKSVLITWT